MTDRLTDDQLQEIFEDHRVLHLMDSAQVVAEIKALKQERDAAKGRAEQAGEKEG